MPLLCLPRATFISIASFAKNTVRIRYNSFATLQRHYSAKSIRFRMTIRFHIFLMLSFLKVLIIRTFFLRQEPLRAVGTLRLLLLVSNPAPNIVTRALATIWDVESSVHVQDDVQVYDDDLHSEVEDIEAPFVLVPSRIVNWSGVLELRTTAEGSPQT